MPDDIEPTDNPPNDPADDTGKPADPPDDKGKPADDKPPASRDSLGDSGKSALDAMKRERNAAKKQLAELTAELKKYQDKDKTETERLTEARDEASTRATKAELQLKKFQTAMERAPEHATLAHVRAVAKRVAGDSEEEMEADADELFELLAPKPSEDDDTAKRKAPPGKPRPNLRGGSDPEDEPEEMDPRKLADSIGRF